MVVLTTRKNPRGLAGAPYVGENTIDLKKIKEATNVFSGTALEAVPAFPANINVAAALSLAGIGAEKHRLILLQILLASEISTKWKLKVRLEGFPHVQN